MWEKFESNVPVSTSPENDLYDIGHGYLIGKISWELEFYYFPTSAE